MGISLILSGDFIDIGLDALNPGQPRLNGLDEMGDRFRGKICFACPIGYQSTAIQGTVQDIYDEVRDYVDKLSTDKGGFMGFVASFNGIYSLGAPEENARAVEKAFEKYCGCGISRPPVEITRAKQTFCG